MTKFISDLRLRAAKLGKHIVLPEGDEPRMYHAARQLVDAGICQVTLLSERTQAEKLAAQEGVDLDGIKLIDPAANGHGELLAATFAELRAKKGVTIDQARDQVKDPLYYGALMVREGLADGMVAGALNSTANVLRAAFQCIGTAPGTSIVSSSFIMIVPDCPYGDNGTMVFADCAINPQPNSEQLADIAVSSAATARALCDVEPRVAMLSFSTNGSGGENPDVEKVVQATRLVREKAPKLQVSGEMQADAALIESIGQKKAPGDPVAGHANVLIFPDLDAANIGYKLTQRLARAEAIGPVSQGLALPVNDLSRGCSVDDIVSVAAITALQTQ
ncbi:phosphate acetyltransferase [bacterium]|nr:phosphate acetyltransferase [bacterium]